jgi:hypothetical protein
MKFLFFLLLLNLSVSLAWSQTLLESIKNDTNHSLNNNSFGSECARAIKKLSKSDFYSENVDRAAIPISENSDDKIYFHYTKASNVRILVKKNEFDKVVAHTKTYSDAIRKVAGPGFYMSSGKNSSSNYGHIRVKIWMKKEARVLPLKLYGTLTHEAKLIESRLIPNLCPSKLIRNIVAESSHVDVVEYSAAYSFETWVILLDANKVKRSKVKSF